LTIEELLMPIDSTEGAVVLITGAAEGIGRATALAFAARGARLWLVDVDEGGLERTAGEARGAGAGTSARRVDVSDAPAMDALAAEVHAEHGALDVLVNNAGVGLAGGFLDTELADWKWILDVNLWGVIHGCRAFVPRMKERGRGQVVNIASAAAFHNMAAMSAYGTSKYAVLGLSEALREELAPHGVGVSAICPGLVRTRIVETMRTRGVRFDDDAARKRVVDLYARRDYAPERVAAVILDAVRRNRAVVPVTAEAWAIHIAKRVAPGATRRVLRWTNRLVDR
jgi:NAD(P)-dependent dehydrogenase (short-subunit alcohol dehydrogenase family)